MLFSAFALPLREELQQIGALQDDGRDILTQSSTARKSPNLNSPDDRMSQDRLPFLL